MAEYIERERDAVLVKLREAVQHKGMGAAIAGILIRYIEKIPAANVAPVVHGRWELHGNDDDCGCSYFCSNCGANYDEDWFYNRGQFVPFRGCPNCFARMDGDSNA